MTIGRDISNDFKKRVPTINFAYPYPGKPYYALIRAEYVPDGATRFGPDHHVLVDVWGLDGTREFGTNVNFTFPEAEPVVVPINKRGVPYGADLPLHNHGHVVGCWVGDDPNVRASDYVQGMGLGRIGSENMDEHVTYYLIYQKMIADSNGTPPVDPPQTDHEALQAIKRIVDARLGTV